METAPAHGTSRGSFLKAGGLGALGTSAAGGRPRALGSGSLRRRRGGHDHAGAGRHRRVHHACPGGEDDPLYIFGFIPVDPPADASAQLITHVQGPRPDTRRRPSTSSRTTTSRSR